MEGWSKFVIGLLLAYSRKSHGSGNPYDNDVFVPEKIPEDWWNGNVTEVLPLPVTRIECAVKCLAQGMEVCNSYIYSNVEGCTLGQLDYVPMMDPPAGIATIDVHVRMAVDRINRTNCLPESPCTINEGTCGFDEDCGHGLKCGKREFNFTCTRCLPVSSLSHASSFHNNDWALFGPENLLDGHARALVETNTFISVHDWNQWVQFEFECPITLTRLYLTNAKWHGFWNGNIWISVKNESVLGVPWTHTIGDEDVCGKISQANLWDASTHELDCTQPMTGQFVILQMRKWERFRWNEVVFFDSYHELGESLETQAVAVTASSLEGGHTPTANAFNKNFFDYFASSSETVPWIQWEFASEVKVIRVILTQRSECPACGAFFKQVGLHVGNTPAASGVLTDNPLCNFIEGPVVHTQQDVIECENEVTGKYFIVQRRGSGTDQLGFNQIFIHGTFT